METLCPTSPATNSSWLIHGHATTWTKEENKRFESALAIFDEKTPYRWFKVAEMIPGKSVYDVINQYRELVADVSDIEAGLVPIPGYLASSFTLELADHRGFEVYRKRGKGCDQERKKVCRGRRMNTVGQNCRRFLLGLQKHGKGDWRNISRNFVISKTPTQVASHAQKYYLRQLSGGKDKRRPSIHDITTVNLDDNCPSETSNELLTVVRNPTNPANNEAPAMAFDNPRVDSFFAKPSHYIFNIGAAAPGFHLKSAPRFCG